VKSSANAPKVQTKCRQTEARKARTARGRALSCREILEGFVNELATRIANNYSSLILFARERAKFFSKLQSPLCRTLSEWRVRCLNVSPWAISRDFRHLCKVDDERCLRSLQELSTIFGVLGEIIHAQRAECLFRFVQLHGFTDLKNLGTEIATKK